MSYETKKEGNSQVTTFKGEESESLKGFITSNAVMPEDEFKGFYDAGGKAVVLQPPHDKRRLKQICAENDTLAPCIASMEVNIDGTGATITHRSDDAEAADTKIVKKLTAFFNEPYPGESFISQRRNLRQDIEQAGEGYLEVLRNSRGEIVFLRYLDTCSMRIVKLDDPVPVKVELVRGDQKVSVTVMKRERRFAQYLGGQMMYFREYGSSRHCNKATGDWYPKGVMPPIKDRATEVLHFKANSDPNSPYGIPRWINQAPSAIGSRAAEEFNLEFFEAGGIPPVIFFLTGGMLIGDTKKALDNILTNGKKTKTRAAVVELAATGGTIDSASSVNVKTERFGTERQQDAMFEKYIGNCSDRIRSSFRLPALFAGKQDAANFATAYVGYVVAEAQVFSPERLSFDTVINNTVMREMAPDYAFRSNPLSIKDANLLLQGIELAFNANTLAGSDIITAVNEALGTNLKYTAGLIPPDRPMGGPAGTNADNQTGATGSRKRKIPKDKANLQGRGDGSTPGSATKADEAWEAAGLEIASLIRELVLQNATPTGDETGIISA